VQEEKRRLWRKLNALQPERPMVMIDQVCWNEMDRADELRCAAATPNAGAMKNFCARLLFQWKHFPVDMVVEPFIRVPKAITNTGFGIQVQEKIAVMDATNSVVGTITTTSSSTMDDLEKVKMPQHQP
jgi:hypothetical protein